MRGWTLPAGLAVVTLLAGCTSGGTIGAKSVVDGG